MNATGAAERLILFVTGDAPRSRRARRNLTAALEALGVQTVAAQEIDLTAEPEQTLAYGVFATPALLKEGQGQGADVLYGDLSDRQALEQFLADFAEDA